MPRSTPYIYLLLLIAAGLVGLLAYAGIPWWTVDDAWISYRYGRNLLETGEFTWNPGDPKVEGYTGSLLPLLAAALLFLGIPLVNGIKVLGMGAAALLMVLFERTLQRLGLDPIRRGVATLLLACTPLIYLHSISGLETIFFTFSLVWVMHALSNQHELFANGKSAWGLGCGLLLSGLCRPEGIALSMLVVLHLLLLRTRFNPLVFKHFILKVILIGLLPLLCYWAWRMGYYGALLPNSFYAKTYDGLLNAESVWAFTKFVGYYAALPAIAAMILGGLYLRHRLHERFLFLSVGAAFLASCLLSYFHANLWMNYGSRFFFPFLPWLLLVTTYFSKPSQPSTGSTRWKAIAISLLLLLQLGIMGFRFKQEWIFLNYYDRIVRDELIPLGTYLKENLPANATVISMMDAGAVGYYSGLKIFDFGRLSDTYLARNQPNGPSVRNYFFAQQATAVVMTSERPDRIQYIPEAMEIVADPRFQAYEWVATWGNQAEYPYWQHLFLRRPPGMNFQ